MGMLRKFFKWLPGAIMALLMFGAGVGPRDAASHLSEWFSMAGIENVPPWLISKSADKWAFWIGLIGLLVWLNCLLIWPKEKKAPQDRLTSSTDSQSSALREAGEKLRAVFTPSLAFLDKAGRHGSDHDRPDASTFLRNAFESHAAAIVEFRHSSPLKTGRLIKMHGMSFVR